MRMQFAMKNITQQQQQQHQHNEKRASEECESAGHHTALHTYIHFD